MRLRDIAYAVPAKRIDAKTIAKWTGADEAFIANKIGVRERAFLGQNETPLSLAKAACENLFARNKGLDPKTIGLVIEVTQNPDFKIPHSSALLQDTLGINSEAACFDVNLGCSGYVYALSIAKGFMAAEGISDALVVTCDPYSRIMGRQDRDTVSVFGDAATASWLSTDGGATIGLADFGTDGSRAEDLIVRCGGAAHPYDGLWNEKPSDTPDDDCRLHMNGRAIFNFVMARVPESLSRCLNRNKVDMEAVDCFVFHQASKFMLEALSRELRLEASKVPINVAQFGNTVSSTIPIVLSEMRDRDELTGKTVLVCGFGVGLSWATNILKF